MRTGLILMFIGGVFVVSAQVDQTTPDQVANAVINDLLSRNEYMMYQTESVHAIHYAEVCAAFGAAKIAGFTGNKEVLANLMRRYSIAVADSIGNSNNHVDANVYGILPLELFMQGADSSFYQQGIAYANDQWENPLPNGLTRQTRFWIDDVWMIGSLQIQAYRATGKQIYLDRAARETVAYLDELQQPNGLFLHGENGPFYWGRGNGWMAAGLAEVLSELNESHADYNSILSGYRKMMNALLTFQAEDGMWRQLVDIDSAWKETSCTAMFGYAIQSGINAGILPAETFGPASEKAWLALSSYLQENGKLTDVCVGTGQSKDINYYLERPTVTGDFHGQAPLLWFAFARMKQ